MLGQHDHSRDILRRYWEEVDRLEAMVLKDKKELDADTEFAHESCRKALREFHQKIEAQKVERSTMIDQSLNELKMARHKLAFLTAERDQGRHHPRLDSLVADELKATLMDLDVGPPPLDFMVQFEFVKHDRGDPCSPTRPHLAWWGATRFPAFYFAPPGIISHKKRRFTVPTPSHGWMTAYTRHGVMSGVHSWAVQVDGGCALCLMVGVVTAGAPLYGDISETHGWWLHADGTLWGAPPTHAAEKPYGVPLRRGSRVVVDLDMDRHTIAFTVDGTPKGVAFTGLPHGPLHPAVSIKGGSDCWATFVPAAPLTADK